MVTLIFLLYVVLNFHFLGLGFFFFEKIFEFFFEGIEEVCLKEEKKGEEGFIWSETGNTCQRS